MEISDKSSIMPKLTVIKRSVRVILRNIFDCSVKLHRLTRGEIEAATKHGYQRDVQLTPNMLLKHLSPVHFSHASSASNHSSAASSVCVFECDFSITFSRQLQNHVQHLNSKIFSLPFFTANNSIEWSVTIDIGRPPKQFACRRQFVKLFGKLLGW